MEKKLRIGRSNVGEINLWRRINVPSKSIYRRRKKKKSYNFTNSLDGPYSYLGLLAG